MEAIVYHPLFVLFLVLSLGIALGAVRAWGFSFGYSAVLFVALAAGHYGMHIPVFVGPLGVLFFIYSIAIQTGPGMINTFRKNARPLISLVSLIIIGGGLMAILVSVLLDVDMPLAAGLFTGALTSTPGLAAVTDSFTSPLPSIGYSLAYPFGVVGVMLFIKLTPILFKFKINEQEAAYEREKAAENPELINRNYRVENPNVDGRSIEELDVRNMTGCAISRIRHGQTAYTPIKKSRLYLGDIIKAVGRPGQLEKVELLIGPQTDEQIRLDQDYVVEWFVVSNRHVVNRSLARLNLFDNYRATITRIRRNGVTIPPSGRSHLHFGDKLLIACPKADTGQLSKLLGNNLKKFSEVNLLPIILGILAGVGIGLANIPFFGGSFKLGLSGGVMLAGLVFSGLGKTGPVIWHVASPVVSLLRRLGLVFFLAGVGTSAGGHIIETLTHGGFTLIMAGMAMTLIPMLLALLAGRFIFRLNYLSLLGMLTGGMTSTPGLGAIENMTGSDAPQVCYAAVYPFAIALILIVCKLFSLLA